MRGDRLIAAVSGKSLTRRNLHISKCNSEEYPPLPEGESRASDIINLSPNRQHVSIIETKTKTKCVRYRPNEVSCQVLLALVVLFVEREGVECR